MSATLVMREGKPGGGKGPLVSDELASALTCGAQQTAFVTDATPPPRQDNPMKPQYTYVSLFSGIEACSVAMSRIKEVEWKPVFFSEIDPFPCAVLAHRFPDVPNLGDICKIRVVTNPETKQKEITNGRTTIPFPGTGIDILAGGSPCQSVSVAGLRHGMLEGSGTRSSLAFEYSRLVEELRPRVILWENVPGVLSADAGLSFYDFLNSLVERGYTDLSWRVLDCQSVRSDSFPRAIPQRRRRVWLIGLRSVGHFGGGEPVSARILSLGESANRDQTPRRETGKGFACPPGYGPRRNDRLVGVAIGGGQIAPSLIASDYKGPGNTQDGKMIVQQSQDAPSPAPSAPPTEKARTDGTSESSCESASFDGRDVSATLCAPNGTPGYWNTELFSQGGAFLARQKEAQIVVMDKEAYNAGNNQTGGLGIKQDDASPNLRATGHAPAIAH